MNMVRLFLFSLFTTSILSQPQSRSHVNKRRTIAQPVKTFKRDPTPKFLQRISFTQQKGFSLACHVCLHISNHVVNVLHAHEQADGTHTQSGWRMDERQTVGFRGQDGTMMDLFDNICNTFQPLAAYSECSKSLCEKVPATSTALKKQISRACNEFREEYEDIITAVARRTEDDNTIAETTCEQIHACTRADLNVIKSKSTTMELGQVGPVLPKNEL